MKLKYPFSSNRYILYIYIYGLGFLLIWTNNTYSFLYINMAFQSKKFPVQCSDQSQRENKKLMIDIHSHRLCKLHAYIRIIHIHGPITAAGFAQFNSVKLNMSIWKLATIYLLLLFNPIATGIDLDPKEKQKPNYDYPKRRRLSNTQLRFSSWASFAIQLSNPVHMIWAALWFIFAFGLGLVSKSVLFGFIRLQLFLIHISKFVTTDFSELSPLKHHVTTYVSFIHFSYKQNTCLAHGK